MAAADIAANGAAPAHLASNPSTTGGPGVHTGSFGASFSTTSGRTVFIYPQRINAPNVRGREQDGDMSDLTDIHSRLGKLEEAMAGVRERVAGIDAQLKHIPTTAQLWKALALSAGAVLAGIFGGAWWIVQQWLSPILEKLSGG